MPSAPVANLGLRSRAALPLSTKRHAAPRAMTKVNMLGNLFGGGAGGGPAGGKVVSKCFFDIEIGGKPAGEADSCSPCRARLFLRVATGQIKMGLYDEVGFACAALPGG
eukprot:746584-Hanusia_phi.AAC.4